MSKLGSYEFMLDKSVDNHYLHRYYDLTAEKVQIAGTTGKEQLLPDSIMWTMDDWAGGGGNNIFYQDEFDIYYASGALNPRIRGQLTSRPDRTKSGTANGGNRAVYGGGWIGRIMTLGAEYFNTADLDWHDWFTSAQLTTITGDPSYLYGLTTDIRFSVGKKGPVTLMVYDVLGREVATLVNEDLPPGVYTARFDASGLSTGTYVYVLTADGLGMSKKMLLAK